MKPFSLSIALCLLLSSTLYAQEDIKVESPDPVGESGFSWDRVFTGGNLGLQFGTITYVDISPVIGYMVTDELALGVGGTYIYYKDNFFNASTSIYGGRLFTRYFITDFLFAHGEYELLNLEALDFSTFETERRWVGSAFLGGGYAQRVGRFSYVYIMVLYNFNESIYSPYTNPVIRVGFNVGL